MHAATRPPAHLSRVGGGGGSTQPPPDTLASPTASTVSHTVTLPLVLLPYSTPPPRVGAGRGRAASARALALSARCARRDRGEVACRAARGLRLPAHHDPSPKPNPNPNPNPTATPTLSLTLTLTLPLTGLRLPAHDGRDAPSRHHAARHELRVRGARRAVPCSAASKSSK